MRAEIEIEPDDNYTCSTCRHIQVHDVCGLFKSLLHRRSPTRDGVQYYRLQQCQALNFLGKERPI